MVGRQLREGVSAAALYLLSDFRDVQGFRVPFKVVAGNMFGTDKYFPFSQAKLTFVSLAVPDARSP